MRHEMKKRGIRNVPVIFSDGSGSATNRYPADMEPGLPINDTSKKFGANHSWEAYTPVKPVPPPDDKPEPALTFWFWKGCR